MFSVQFEVHPHPDRRGDYLAYAKNLRPELEQVPGFVDYIHYRSLTREGWILSLSGWRDEKAAVRWRTRMRHHEAQQAGRNELLADYRLRAGQITSDTRVPDGQNIVDQRLDQTEVGQGTALTLIDASQTAEWVAANNPQEIALYLGFDLYSYGDCISWDVYEAVHSPGGIMLLVTWKDAQSANDHASAEAVPDGARVRVVRVVRDYAMFDRREAPQYYPDAAGRETIKA